MKFTETAKPLAPYGQTRIILFTPAPPSPRSRKGLPMLTYRGKRIPPWFLLMTLGIVAGLFGALCWID